MPSIGETLREARMRQKLDITDVEAATKIRAKYLRALENEEFDMLHGSTFVRSFLRTYAQHLGLDPQRLVEEYRARYEPRDEAEFHPIVSRPQRGRERPRPPSRAPIAVGLVVTLLAFLLVLGLTGDDDGEDRGTETAARTSTAEEREERRRPRSRRRRATPASRVVAVRIAPATPTYVCVDRGDGGAVLFEGTLEDARTFRGRRVRINVGKTSAGVRVNGRRLDLGGGSDPVGYDITSRRARPLPEEDRPCV